MRDWTPRDLVLLLAVLALAGSALAWELLAPPIPVWLAWPILIFMAIFFVWAGLKSRKSRKS